MPITDLALDGAGNYSQWGFIGCADYTGLIDSNDSSFLADAVNGHLHSFTVAAMPSAAQHVYWYRSYQRAQENAANGHFKVFTRDGGVDSATTAQIAVDTNWTWYESPSIVYPGGGTGDWTPALVNSAELGLFSDVAGGICRISELYARIYWRPFPGGWMSIIRPALGLLIGASLSLAEMPGLVAHHNRVTTARQVIRVQEIPELYAGLKDYKHRRCLWLR
jgi:hypothetical protein